MPIKLTDTAIQTAIRQAGTSGRRDLSDAGLPGLRLRIAKSGRATWVLACRDSAGGMRRFPLGDYQQMGLSAARDAARELRVQVRKGADPIADQRQQRALGLDAKAGRGTLKAVIDLYETKVGKGIKSWPISRRRIELVFADLLEKSLLSIKRIDLQIAIDAYQAPQQARGGAFCLRPVLKWAAVRGYAPAELTMLEAPAKTRRRERVLTQGELRALLPVLRASSGAYAKAMLAMLFTLLRREEVCGARWRDIDLDGAMWRIESVRAKNRVEHSVPLSRQAVDLLKGIGPGKHDALVFCSPTGGRLTNWDRATKAIMTASGTSGWTRHDLRRTGATMLGEMGELPHVIEAALNHVTVHSQIATIYNQSRYRPQVAAALQSLVDVIDGLVLMRKENSPNVRPSSQHSLR